MAEELQRTRACDLLQTEFWKVLSVTWALSQVFKGCTHVAIASVYRACVFFAFIFTDARKYRQCFVPHEKFLLTKRDLKLRQIPKPTYGIISIFCVVIPAGSQDRKKRKQQIV
jgi:hypothetical protein